MTSPMRHSPISCTVFAAALPALLAACATSAPTIAGGDPHTTIEGRVTHVDTSPWAYDGNAVVRVASPGRGDVAVQLPARWNLCKAPPVDDVQGLQPGARVRVTGTLGETGELVVCEHAAHGLQRLD